MPGYKYAGTVLDANDPWPVMARNRTGQKREDTPLEPCGTPTAYRRHKAKGEPVDDACRQANIDDCRARRQNREART